MTQPDFIQIPTQLLSDSSLQPSDRILFGYIYWMTKLALMKCVAGNDTLAELTGFSIRGIQQSLVRLEQQGYIRRIFVGKGDRHRENIECLLAYSALKPKIERTNVRSRTNKRAYPERTNVHHNKKREEEHLNRSTNVLVNSASPPSPKRTFKTLFNEIVLELGFTDKVKPTDGRIRKLKARNKTFTYDELITAAKVLGADAYMQGDNPSGKRYGDIDYFLRSDEVVDKYLNKDELAFNGEGAF